MLLNEINHFALPLGQSNSSPNSLSLPPNSTEHRVKLDSIVSNRSEQLSNKNVCPNDLELLRLRRVRSEAAAVALGCKQ